MNKHNIHTYLYKIIKMRNGQASEFTLNLSSNYKEIEY